MRKIGIITCFLFCTILSVNASTNRKNNLTDHGKSFVQMMIPQVKYVNYGISLQRKTLIINRDYFAKTGILTYEDIYTVNGIAARYDFHKLDVRALESKEEVIDYFNTLLERVDCIPEKMILAQAILESGWGKSKSSQACNNYFGLTCRGCGGYMVTGNEYATYYLKSYKTVTEGVQDYAYILNTKRSYFHFRKLRAELRQKGHPIDSQVLTGGLMNYSELGQVYIDKINFVIYKYLDRDLLYYMHMG